MPTEFASNHKVACLWIPIGLRSDGCLILLDAMWEEKKKREAEEKANAKHRSQFPGQEMISWLEKFEDAGCLMGPHMTSRDAT